MFFCGKIATEGEGEEEEEERGERTDTSLVSRIFLSQLAVPLASVRASFSPFVPRVFFAADSGASLVRERKKGKKKRGGKIRTDNLDLKLRRASGKEVVSSFRE